jgi:hypothetical protein
MGSLYSFVESGIGLPHSKTLARFRACLLLREVLECGSPMPLFERLRFADDIQSHPQTPPVFLLRFLSATRAP